MINDIITTAIVNSVIGYPLYYFGRDEKLADERHRTDCIEEATLELKHADEEETANLTMLIRFLTTAPLGKILTDSNCDDEGNYIPKGWAKV